MWWLSRYYNQPVTAVLGDGALLLLVLLLGGAEGDGAVGRGAREATGGGQAWGDTVAAGQGGSARGNNWRINLVLSGGISQWLGNRTFGRLAVFHCMSVGASKPAWKKTT